jgi:hypothetical protein
LVSAVHVAVSAGDQIAPQVGDAQSDTGEHPPEQWQRQPDDAARVTVDAIDEWPPSPSVLNAPAMFIGSPLAT